MRVRVENVLDAPAQWVWEMAQKPSTLQHVSWPLLVFKLIGAKRLPDRWQADTLQVRLQIFGIIPAGTQTIAPSMSHHGPEDGNGACWLRDNGSGDIARVWDHWIRITHVDSRTTHYVDDVQVKAGILTPFVGLFAHLFYRYRQWRWRRLAARLGQTMSWPDEARSL